MNAKMRKLFAMVCLIMTFVMGCSVLVSDDGKSEDNGDGDTLTDGIDSSDDTWGDTEIDTCLGGECSEFNCAPCDDASVCGDGQCVCADETCAIKRCRGAPIGDCAFLAGGESDCAPQNVLEKRWGPNCSGDDTIACDADGVCRKFPCANCSHVGCDLRLTHEDCGTHDQCGSCLAVDECEVDTEGNTCSLGDAGCEDHCDGAGHCNSAEGRDCGADSCASTCSVANECQSNGTICDGYGVCGAKCSEGACGAMAPSTQTCGGTGGCTSGICNGLGSCELSDNDCGVCCTCGPDGLPGMGYSHSECSGYDSSNPCSQRCVDQGKCGYPGSETSCGKGAMCQDSCDGLGSCGSEGNACCSTTDTRKTKCDSSDVCIGTCDVKGYCTGFSAFDKCLTICNKGDGICSPNGTGLCRCPEDRVCAAYIDAKHIDDVCDSADWGVCCGALTNQAGKCCGSTFSCTSIINKTCVSW